MADRQQGYDDFGEMGDAPPANNYGEPDMPEYVAPPAPAPVPPPVPSLPPAMEESLNEKSNELQEQVSDKMNSAASSIKESFSKFDSNRAISIALTTIAVLAVSGIVVVSLYYMMKKGAVKTTSVLLAESKVPLLGSEYKKLDGAAIPRAYNGKRMTISFWVYIHDVDRYKGVYRHIWHRGDKSVVGGSPIVFLDKDTNRMHIRFEKTTNITQSLTMAAPFDGVFNEKIMDRASGNKAESKFEGAIVEPSQALDLDLATHGITIDYIPLQRWVHVAIVVNEEINGGIIYAYVDGELVKQEMTGRKVSREVVVKGYYANDATKTKKTIQTTITKERDFKNLNLDKPGDVYTGGATVEDVGPGFSGLTAGFYFANHDLSAKDIYAIYVKGPVDNLASKLGLPAYGVRSPVYRM